MERVLKEAEIGPGAVRYQVLAAVAATVATVFGIVLLPIIWPLSHWYWTRYYGHLRVVLTARELKVHRGILNREEKHIPLEKITDLAVFQGPIMRWLDLKGIKVETAGQSSGAGGALVRIVGIVDTDGFRDQVLRQRDRITDRDDGAPAAPAAAATAALPGRSDSERALLEAADDIRATLRRIEAALTKE